MMSDCDGYPATVEELDDELSRPSTELIEMIGRQEGDFILLGVGGKMGPTMARMLQRAVAAANSQANVLGVSRFSRPETRQLLESWGVRTISCDLLSAKSVADLPRASNVISLIGFKFGASAAPAKTWAVNCYVPALVAAHFADSRIVAFSTGNVYGHVSAAGTGSRESDEPNPQGEYAMAALGRERMYQFLAEQFEIPTCILRLNYATELRYGVLVDLAQSIQAERPIDLATAYVNLIWQRDANDLALRSLAQTSCPARIINVAGFPQLAVTDLCASLGEHLGKKPSFQAAAGTSALLSDGRLGHQLLGTPSMPLDRMIEWTARWVANGNPTLDKPTHFQVRDGRF